MLRRGPRGPFVAPLSDFLLLSASRRRRVDAGPVEASGKVGRWRIRVHAPDPAHAPPAELVTLEALLDQLVPQLSQPARDRMFEIVFEAVKEDLGGPGGSSLSHSLRLLRDRLHEPLPELPAERSEPHLVVLDVLAAVGGNAFWAFGWANDADGTPARVDAVSPEGQRTDLLPGAPRFDREDVTESLVAAGVPSPRHNGFARYFELEAPSPASEGWVTELRAPSGAAFRSPGPTVKRDPQGVRETMLWPFTVDRAELEPVRRDHAYPALKRLQEHAARQVEVVATVDYGTVPDAAEVSIVVPLYRRIDLIEHQMAQFWQDPELAQAELVYVLDSPELAEQLSHLAGPLHELYGLPFRIVTLSRNGGYAVANNIGAAHAHGRLLLLLNSDVLPSRPGWLGRMRAFYDATPEIGALGPKLLFEDESIQHAGMYFKRDPSTRHWENQHYFKGFTRSLPPANVSRPVPAVTGACLMVERTLFESLEGLATVYVQGGYEDSDFCLRVAETGRRNWYVADVELYHLEAQSFFIETRHANPCNAWIQTHLWDERIEALMQAQPDPADTRLLALG
jgi:GT2 family glycosyltransferase